MVGLIVLREESGTDQINWGQSGFWVLVGGKSTTRPSHFAWEEAIGKAESIGAAYRGSYPQLIHRSDPELSTIALWTAKN